LPGKSARHVSAGAHEAGAGGSWAASTGGTQGLGQLFPGSGGEGGQGVHSQPAASPCTGTLHSRVWVSCWPDPSRTVAPLVCAAPAHGTAAHPLCPSHEQDWGQLRYPMQSHNLSALKIPQVNMTPAAVLHFPSKQRQGCLPRCLFLPHQGQVGQGEGKDNGQ